MASELMSSSLFAGNITEGIFLPMVPSAQSYMQQYSDTSSQPAFQETHGNCNTQSSCSKEFAKIADADMNRFGYNGLYIPHCHKEESEYENALLRLTLNEAEQNTQPFHAESRIKEVQLQADLQNAFIPHNNRIESSEIKPWKVEGPTVMESNVVEANAKYCLAGLWQVSHTNIGLVCASKNDSENVPSEELLDFENWYSWNALETSLGYYAKGIETFKTEVQKEENERRSVESRNFQGYMGSSSYANNVGTAPQQLCGEQSRGLQNENKGDRGTCVSFIELHNKLSLFPEEISAPGSSNSCGHDCLGNAPHNLPDPTPHSPNFADESGLICSSHTFSEMEQISPKIKESIGVGENITQADEFERPGEAPHSAISFALMYLRLSDLLSVERVCKSLRAAVKDEPFLWTHLHVDHPLSKRLTNDALFQLSARAKGNLKCLSLVECVMITENGLKRVLDNNPKLTKLCLPRCTRISPDGLVNIVKELNEQTIKRSRPRLKYLRINGLYGLTKVHVESLKASISDSNKHENLKPRFYHNRHYFSLYDDDERSLDVDICPKCESAMLIYDCPREKCQQKKHNQLEQCRGCILCISRCAECGCCIKDNEFEETFSLDILCFNCWSKHPKGLEYNKSDCRRHTAQYLKEDAYIVCGNCRSICTKFLKIL